MSQRLRFVPPTRLVLLGALAALAVAGCGSTGAGTSAAAPATRSRVAAVSRSASAPAPAPGAASSEAVPVTTSDGVPPAESAPASGATPTGPVSTAVGSTVVPPPPPPPPPPTAEATAVPTLTPGRSDRCHASELSVRQGGGQGAAGTLLGTLVLTDTARVTCTLYGYPGLQLLDGRRHYLPTTAVRGVVPGGAPAPALVLLRPGGQAHARYDYNHVPTGGGSAAGQCPVSGYLEVTPPDETDFLLLRVALDPCNGRIVVGPVQAGGGTTG